MKKHLDNLYKPNSKVKSFGAGWGGEPPAINPSIKTTSKKNKMGEIINPTKKDIEEYNKKYVTVKPKPLLKKFIKVKK